MHFKDNQEYLRYITSGVQPVEPEKYVEPVKEDAPTEESEEKPRVRRGRKA